MSAESSLSIRRITRVELYGDLVFSLAQRSTCNRAQVGALVTTSWNSREIIVGTGYNGSPSGMPHCIEGECLLDDQGRCKRTIHAEVNAISSAIRHHDFTPILSTLWATHEPCFECYKLIIATGIPRVKAWVAKTDRDHAYLPQGLVKIEFLPRSFRPRT